MINPHRRASTLAVKPSAITQLVQFVAAPIVHSSNLGCVRLRFRARVLLLLGRRGLAKRASKRASRIAIEVTERTSSLANAVHAAAHAARVTGDPPDVPALLETVSDAPRHILVTLEDLDRPVL